MSERDPLLSPWRTQLVVVLFAFCGFVLLPEIRAKLGFSDLGVWFLDSYALLAASDARAAGLDPSQPNPLDVFHRPHSYSSWWFGLHHVGLTRTENFLLGGAFVVAFLAAALALLRPRSAGQAIGGIAATLSPPVLLALSRGNNDLIVFAIVTASALVMTKATTARTAVFSAGIAVATGLKFYPLAAAAGLLPISPARRACCLAIGTLLLAGIVLASQWTWFRQAVIPVPTGLYLLGAPILWREFGLEGPWVMPASVVLMTVAGAALAWRGWTSGLASEAEPLHERIAFSVGAVLLLACWLLGISYAYRWILLLLLIPWLWRRLGTGSPARVALWGVFVQLWADGLFCLVTNGFIGRLPIDTLETAQHYWQLVLQPLAWILMAQLAGWLVQLAWARAAEAARKPGAP